MDDEAPIISESYTKVPNEILEALCRTKLSSYEIRALFVILRMTWGWHKESDTIAHRQISNMTGIDRRNVFRVLEGLADRRIVAISRDGRKAPTYRINKNLAEWRLPSPQMAARKKTRYRLTAITPHGKPPSPYMAEVPSRETHELPCERTRSEEIRKERKERVKESALRAGPHHLPEDSDSETVKEKPMSLVAEYQAWRSVPGNDLSYQKWLVKYA